MMGITDLQHRGPSNGQDFNPLLSSDVHEDLVERGDSFSSGHEQSSRENDPQSSVGDQLTLSSRWVRLRRKATRWRAATGAALRGWIKRELIALFRLTLPVILTLLFHNLMFFVALLFVGHITGTSLELDSVALAFSFVNVTGVSIGIGLATACDTLCAQAFGYKNYKRVGFVLQRAILILGIAVLPIWALWLNAESFLLLLQQTPCVARLTGQYVKVYCVALPFIFLYFLLQQYLQAQGIVWVFVVVGLLTNILNAALHGVLVLWVEMGVQGAAISLVTSNVAAPLMVIAYTRLRNLHKKTWDGWTWESLREWGLFTKLGIPGLFMICFEWWAVEVAMFVAGSISETQLAINSILIQPLIIMFMVPLGISIAISIRVGNELGAGNPKGAKQASYMAFAINFAVGTFYIALIQATKNHIGRLFSNEDEVIEGVSEIMNVVCLFTYSGQIQLTVAGILRGSGRQYLGAVINFTCYYLIGLPVGISLALKADMGTLGLWIGLTAGNVVQAVLALVAFFTTNWEKESQKAMKRAQGSPEKAMETIQRRDNDSSIMAESESQLELHDETDVANQEGKECYKAPESVSLCSSESSSTLDDLTTEKMEEIPLYPLGSPERHLDEEEKEEEGKEEGAREGNVSVPAAVVTSTRKSCKSKTKLLLYRGAFFVLGLAIIVGGVVSSQYHPEVGSGNYTECSDVWTNSSDGPLEQSGILLDFTSTIKPMPTHIPHGPTPTPVLGGSHTRTSRQTVDSRTLYDNREHSSVDDPTSSSKTRGPSGRMLHLQ